MMRSALFGLAILAAATPALADPFDDVMAAHPDFSGAVLVERNGDIMFDKAYGLADAERGIANRPSTSFHIGTLSMQYTAYAVLKLADAHRLTLDNTADQFVPGAPFVTLRALLDVAPDAPAAAGDYELLGRVMASAAGKPFADTLEAAAIASVWMNGTGVDDGTLSPDGRMAKGYSLDHGTLKPSVVDWSALAGAATVYTTTRDELHWLDRFFDDEMLTAASRGIIFAAPEGFGWHHDRRFGRDAYWGEGQAPGFSSFVLRAPDDNVTIIVLANVEGPGTAVGESLTAEVLRHPGR